MNVGNVFMKTECDATKHSIIDDGMKKMNVLMVGPARNVKGGMTTVVDNYFNYGLSTLVNLGYCESINDKSKIEKAIKEIRGYIDFCRVLKNYDLVHIHMASGRSTFRKLLYIKKAKRLNKKVIVHVHGGGFADFYDSQNHANMRKIKKGLNRADKIIVLSQEWEKYFSKIVAPQKIEVLYNGVEIPQPFHKEYKNNNILFLGRICRDKGIYELLSAVKQLINKYPNLVLNICGSGEEDEVLKYIRNYELEGNVNLIGWVAQDEREKQLRENSIFVLPSKFEAMPMSLLEAMAYKNVPVCTKVGGIPQIIRDGKNGIYISDSTTDAIKEALETVLNWPCEKQIMAEHAFETIENKFNIANNVMKLYNIYLEVMAEQDDNN